MSNEISVLLADDHGLVRKGFRRMLEDDPEIRVVGEATNGQEAIKLAQELHPHVIVMDMAMPGLDGVQATREILKHAPEIAVLILSMYSEENYVRNALDAGARGYLLKEALDVDLAGAIKELAAGKNVIGPGVLAPNREPDPDYERLTPREKQILELIAKGNSNKEIAAHAEPEREHGLGAPRQSDVRAGHPPHYRVGGVGGRKGIGAACREPPGVSSRRAGHAVPGAPSDRTSASASPMSPPPAGIRFPHNSGAFGEKYLPETLGPGCAFLDYDNDGWQDILLINGMDWPGHRKQRSTMQPVSQQSQRHIHRCHARRRTGCRDVRHGRGGRRLQ